MNFTFKDLYCLNGIPHCQSDFWKDICQGCAEDKSSYGSFSYIQSSNYFEELLHKEPSAIVNRLYFNHKLPSKLFSIDVGIPVALVKDTYGLKMRFAVLSSPYYSKPPLKSDIRMISATVKEYSIDKLSDALLKYIYSFCPIYFRHNGIMLPGYEFLPVISSGKTENDALTVLILGDCADDITFNNHICLIKSDGSLVTVTKEQFINIVRSPVSFTNFDKKTLRIKKTVMRVAFDADLTDTISVFGDNKFDVLKRELSLSINELSGPLIVPEGITSITLNGVNNQNNPVTHIVIPTTCDHLYIHIDGGNLLQELIIKANAKVEKAMSSLRSNIENLNFPPYYCSCNLRNISKCTIRMSTYTPIINMPNTDHYVPSFEVHNSTDVTLISRSFLPTYSDIFENCINAKWIVSDKLTNNAVY